MFDAWLHAFEAWVRAHAELAFAATFVIAFLESFPIISILVPSTALLLAIGAMVGAGLVDPWPILGACALGGVLGDACGFWLARWIGPYAVRKRLPNSWRRPYAWATRVFLRWGWLAVFCGRFIGPMRAVAPLAAGVIGMENWRFQSANILSALIWAPLIIMPGTVGGWIASRIKPEEAPYAIVLAAIVALSGWMLFRRYGPTVSAHIRTRLEMPRSRR
ncbi:DedA family protein [Acetobacteraceae bacterium H6797]|nr:DedA family protein [Acetobacteraceae bacterium H6797]